jgi:hypothetical protein
MPTITYGPFTRESGSKRVWKNCFDLTGLKQQHIFHSGKSANHRSTAPTGAPDSRIPADQKSDTSCITRYSETETRTAPFLIVPVESLGMIGSAAAT